MPFFGENAPFEAVFRVALSFAFRGKSFLLDKSINLLAFRGYYVVYLFYRKQRATALGARARNARIKEEK